MPADTNLLLDLTPRQVEVIRQSLRTQEESHKRNGFPVLQDETSALRSHIADAVIDNAKAMR